MDELDHGFEREPAGDICELLTEAHELGGNRFHPFHVCVEEGVNVCGLVFDDTRDELLEARAVLQRVVFFFEVELEADELGRPEGELDELGVEHAFEDREIVVVEVCADVLVDVWSA